MNDTPQAEQLKNEAASAAEQAADLRVTVRDMTLRALKSRELNLGEVKNVLRSVSEGLSIGLEKRGGEIKGAAAEAMAGLDEAVQKSAEATKLAAEQLISQGKEFTEQDIKPVYEDLKRLEGELLDAISHASERAGSRVRQEFTDLLNHARRAGTDTGRVVADTLSQFNGRAGSAVKSGAAEGAVTAREFSKRLALVASGILAGMADVLHEKAGGTKKAD